MEENLQNEEQKFIKQDEPETCGGKPKPANPVGEVGEWSCVGDEWTWIPFIG